MSTVEDLEAKLDKFMDKIGDDVVKINDSINTANTDFSDRLSKVEGSVQDIISDRGHANIASGVHVDYRATRSHRPSFDTALGPTSSTQRGATEDAETQYSFVKDSVSKVSLDTDYEVASTKKNIKRQDHTAIDIIGKCGGYAGTTLKVLAAFDKDTDSVDGLVNYMYMISLAQVRYLQTKYSALAIKGNIDESTSKMYDMLENNSLKLNERAYNHLETAAKLSSIRQPQASQSQQNQQGKFNQQGRFNQQRRNNYQGSNQQGRNQDTYSNFANKQFPAKKHNSQDGSNDSAKE